MSPWRECLQHPEQPLVNEFLTVPCVVGREIFTKRVDARGCNQVEASVATTFLSENKRATWKCRLDSLVSSSKTVKTFTLSFPLPSSSAEPLMPRNRTHAWVSSSSHAKSSQLPVSNNCPPHDLWTVLALLCPSSPNSVKHLPSKESEIQFSCGFQKKKIIPISLL